MGFFVADSSKNRRKGVRAFHLYKDSQVLNGYFDLLARSDDGNHWSMAKRPYPLYSKIGVIKGDVMIPMTSNEVHLFLFEAKANH